MDQPAADLLTLLESIQEVVEEMPVFRPETKRRLADAILSVKVDIGLVQQ